MNETHGMVNLSDYYPPIPESAMIYHHPGGRFISYRSNYGTRVHLYSSTSTWCEACGFDESTTLMWVLKYGESLPLKIDDLPQIS